MGNQKKKKRITGSDNKLVQKRFSKSLEQVHLRYEKFSLIAGLSEDQEMKSVLILFFSDFFSFR